MSRVSVIRLGQYAVLLFVWSVSFAGPVQFTWTFAAFGVAVVSWDGTVYVRGTQEIDKAPQYPSYQGAPLANFVNPVPLSPRGIRLQLLPLAEIRQTPIVRPSERTGLPSAWIPPRRFNSYQLSVPWWLICALVILWPPRLIQTWRTQRRKTLQKCVACGYDLRATPERCPECGTVPAASGSTAKPASQQQ